MNNSYYETSSYPSLSGSPLDDKAIMVLSLNATHINPKSFDSTTAVRA